MGKTVNILGFEDYYSFLSLPTTYFCHCSVKAAIDEKKKQNPFYLQKEAMGPDLAYGQLSKLTPALTQEKRIL